MEDDQQFCLRWNNHQSTLVAVFDTLLENGTLVDCTLAAEGKYLNAHKVVLSACSPYFESLLSQNYDKHPIFILKDVKYQELKAMMDYMYRGEVNISQDQLGALLKAAESLQIKGLSDNRKGETTDTKKGVTQVPPPSAKSPPPQQQQQQQQASLPRVQGLTIEQRRRELEDSREGSQSPGARKRKRMRRRSLEDLDNHHDASNSSESHHSGGGGGAATTPSAVAAVVQNIPATVLPPAAVAVKAAPASDSADSVVDSKAELLAAAAAARHKASAAVEPDASLVPTKEKLETHSELMLEPKAEYIDEVNEDSIEDLTLDDDDISNMEQMDDSTAGPSHGNMGEAAAQGFGGWHMGNQSQDEVFLAAQEAVGAHRDSQDHRCPNCMKKLKNRRTLRCHLKCCGVEKQYQCHLCEYKCYLKTRLDDHCNRVHKDGVAEIKIFPCTICNKRYKSYESMMSHKSMDCGNVNRHFCERCGKLFKRYWSLKRHVEICKGAQEDDDNKFEVEMKF